jgi:hypothetical protein
MRAESYRQQGSRKSQHMMIIAQATERVSPTLALKEGTFIGGAFELHSAKSFA